MKTEKLRFADGRTRRAGWLSGTWSIKVDEEVRKDFSLPARRIKVFAAVHGHTGTMAAFKDRDGNLYAINPAVLFPKESRCFQEIMKAGRILHSNGNGSNGRREVARNGPTI